MMMTMMMMGWRAAICCVVTKVVELGIFALPFAIDCRRHREGWRAAICCMVIKVVELGIFALPFTIDCRRHRES